jgi:hypothetical protein
MPTAKSSTSPMFDRRSWGTFTLIFIEVQRGSYIAEDDIVRLEDDFGRAS